MLKLALALSIIAAAPMVQPAADVPPAATASASWSAGWEAGYLDLCGITPDERAAWAAPAPLAPADIPAFEEGFAQALDEAADYEGAGFDLVEWCGDVHP